MLVFGTSRKHRTTVKVLYFTGFFLLFCSLGAFGSATLLSYRATHWPEATAQIHDCSLREYEHGTLFALHCDITYELAGRTYKSMLHSHLTRSLEERSELSRWMASNRRGALMIRINPRYSDEFVVTTPLPFRRGENPGDFINAAILLGSVSFLLLLTARALVRRGW